MHLHARRGIIHAPSLLYQNSIPDGIPDNNGQEVYMNSGRLVAVTPNAVAFSLEDASKAAGGISRRTLYNEMQAGRLASKMIGRRRVIPLEALRAWIEAAPDGGAPVANDNDGGR